MFHFFTGVRLQLAYRLERAAYVLVKKKISKVNLSKTLWHVEIVVSYCFGSEKKLNFIFSPIEMFHFFYRGAKLSDM